ncbi:MAG: hypothetical protein J5507_03865 [Clostridia bacterium]|nr:hypothetical protein [Clostridia bacterium]
MKKLTDEQAAQAKEIIDNYNKEYQKSIKNIAKHRVPCDGEDSIVIASRELNVEGNEIIFPPYGQSFTTKSEDYIKINTNKSEKQKKGVNRDNE